MQVRINYPNSITCFLKALLVEQVWALEKAQCTNDDSYHYYMDTSSGDFKKMIRDMVLIIIIVLAYKHSLNFTHSSS